jgi:hypothetical protein
MQRWCGKLKHGASPTALSSLPLWLSPSVLTSKVILYRLFIALNNFPPDEGTIKFYRIYFHIAFSLTKTIQNVETQSTPQTYCSRKCYCVLLTIHLLFNQYLDFCSKFSTERRQKKFKRKINVAPKKNKNTTTKNGI